MYTQIPLNSSSAIIGYKHLEVGSKTNSVHCKREVHTNKGESIFYMK